MDELSVGASLVPRVKRAVQSLTHSECHQLIPELLELDTSAAILGRCTEMAQKHYADLLG
jgi:phosphotransferase system enzyme I (PtsI)